MSTKNEDNVQLPPKVVLELSSSANVLHKPVRRSSQIPLTFVAKKSLLELGPPISHLKFLAHFQFPNPKEFRKWCIQNGVQPIPGHECTSRINRFRSRRLDSKHSICSLRQRIRRTSQATISCNFLFCCLTYHPSVTSILAVRLDDISPERSSIISWSPLNRIAETQSIIVFEAEESPSVTLRIADRLPDNSVSYLQRREWNRSTIKTRCPIIVNQKHQSSSLNTI